ncbi:MAG: long-chain fatty acid--CoA ligase [Bacteroidales bacterium]|nr:long-chain fatty acid--CoA ligase [Bacteroidales bacterium]
MGFDFEPPYNQAPYTNLLETYEQSFRDNFNLPALTDYVSGKSLTYGDFARRIARLHLFFDAAGVRPGDKIALLGRNTPNWVISFMSVITYGAVIVPILNEFNPVDATNIINHSDAVILFASDSNFNVLNFDDLPAIKVVISLDNRTILAERSLPPEVVRKSHTTTYHGIVANLTRWFHDRYPKFSASDISYPHVDGSAVAVINYTSGTTGFSKGVMLTHDNLRGNVVFGIRSKLHYSGSRALSFLPLAHAYGCAFDMLTPLAVGSHVTLLGKIPTPQLLLKALKQVRPNLIICVPLIIEKIYRKVVVPMITKKPMRWVLAVPMLDKAVYTIIRNKLVEAFGGAFEEVIVGGAPLNSEVEEFLYRIRFPFTVGYGMTECGPLISYSPWRKFECGSSGRTLRNIMEAKIDCDPDSDTPTNQGEIMVRGLNVMKGYYKNPEATAEVLDADGWLHTGDMGFLSGYDHRTINIRGRYKTMILSATGQNIYPEEIEAKLSNMPYVGECLIIERDKRLIGLVYPDQDEVAAHALDAPKLEEAMKHNLEQLNQLVAPYEQVAAIEIMPSEFEKTPKRSIRRFLYK